MLRFGVRRFLLQQRFHHRSLQCIHQHQNCSTTLSATALVILPRSGFSKSSHCNAVIPLTSSVMKGLVRGNYAKLEESDIVVFKEILGNNPSQILTESSDIEGFNIDWMKTCRGSSQLVLKPKSTEEVSRILAHCNSRGLALVPQSGNTGLVGGSVPVFDEIVLSMQLMNKVLEVNDISGIVTVEAGVVLEALDQHVSNHGLCVPLDLGAKGSCMIGGNVSTNAGGLRLLRYGSLHGSVLGLEVVLADGRVLDCLSTLRKDNTGYDLKQMFIGSEGTLGVITKVALLCPPRPSSVNVAFFGCQTFDRVLQLFTCARRNLSEVLSAFEYMDAASMKCVEEKLRLTNPLTSSFPFYVLVETSGSSLDHDRDKMDRFLEIAMTTSLVDDGIVAQDSQQATDLFQVRERIAEAVVASPTHSLLDVSLPLSVFWDLVTETQVVASRVSAPVLVSSFGHLGDGNIHLNFTSEVYEPEVLNILEPFVFEWVAAHKGSVSAEHGLGLKKARYIGYSKTPHAIQAMRDIKKVFDPRGILNPYKVLPPE